MLGPTKNRMGMRVLAVRMNFSVPIVKIAGPPQKAGCSSDHLSASPSLLTAQRPSRDLYLFGHLALLEAQRGKTDTKFLAQICASVPQLAKYAYTCLLLKEQTFGSASSFPLTAMELGGQFFCSPSADGLQKLGIRWVLVASEFTIIQAESTLPEFQHYMNLWQQEVSSPHTVWTLASTSLWTCKSLFSISLWHYWTNRNSCARKLTDQPTNQPTKP